MSKVKVMIVEDEMVIAMNITEHLNMMGYETTLPASNYDQAVTMLKTEKPDIVLLDIQLKGNKTGIDIAHSINQSFNVPFIFLTSNSDIKTLNEAKEALPASYILKPFNKEDLFTAIEVAIHNFNNQRETKRAVLKDSIFVKNQNLFHKIKLEEVVYLKSEHVYLEIYTLDNKKHLIRSGLSHFIETLPSNFFQTHRSYAVNLNHLDAVNSHYVVVNKVEIPIGKTYRTELMDIIRVE